MAPLPNEPDGTTPADYELRSADAVELRVAGEDKAPVLTGYAVVYNSPAKIQGWDGEFTETFLPGAFDEELRSNKDIRFLREHWSLFILSRTAAKTLVLTSDARGLRFESQVPDTQLGRDTVADVRNGNLRGMSFGFVPTETERAYDGKGRLTAVQVKRARLLEITITATPYYPKTSVAVRSIMRQPVPAGDLGLRLRLLKLRG